MASQNLSLRLATMGDAGAILDIYSHYINNTTFSFECEVPSAEEFHARMLGIMAEYPYIVCEDGGRIVGYAYAHRHQSRAAYCYSAELSVYLRPQYVGLGIGRLLSRAVIDLLRRQNVQTVYSAVSLPNDPSCAMHDALGFKQVGLWHNTGRKLGRWLDIAWYELVIGDYPDTPAPLIAFDELDKPTVIALLRKYTRELTEGSAK